jgi:hypothetical protein
VHVRGVLGGGTTRGVEIAAEQVEVRRLEAVEADVLPVEAGGVLELVPARVDGIGRPVGGSKTIGPNIPICTCRTVLTWQW